jgi:hypothetical protein
MERGTIILELPALLGKLSGRRHILTLLGK